MRLFLALALPEDVADALVGVMEGVAGARWVPSDNLHLTLRFLGEVDRHAVRDLDAALMSLRHPAFDLWLEGAGVFEHRGRAEALWIGAGPQAPLDALHRKVDQAAAAAGLGHETRAYRPHVTLARLPRGAGPPGEAMARIGRLGRLGLRASEVTLYESRLGAGDPHYVPLARYPLATSDPARLRPPAPLA